MTDKKQEFIQFMIESGVLTFGDFMTKSSRRTPYFINTGNYKTGRQISILASYYAECIKECVGDKFDLLFGPAYKGIPLATATAAALYTGYGIDCGYSFNRKEAKDHGEGGSIVGAKPGDGDRVLIIEDVVTAGTSVRETVPLLKSAADVTITDMIISVNRMEKCESGLTAVEEVFKEYGITVHSIVNVKEIYEYIAPKFPADIVRRMEVYMDRYCVGVKSEE